MSATPTPSRSETKRWPCSKCGRKLTSDEGRWVNVTPTEQAWACRDQEAPA